MKITYADSVLADLEADRDRWRSVAHQVGAELVRTAIRAAPPKVVAFATRSGDYWAIEVPSIPGLFTQVRDLDDAPSMVKAAAADLLDVEVVVATGHNPPAIRRVVYPAGDLP